MMNLFVGILIAVLAPALLLYRLTTKEKRRKKREQRDGRREIEKNGFADRRGNGGLGP